MLNNEALPFYAKRNLNVEGILTQDGRDSSVGARATPTGPT